MSFFGVLYRSNDPLLLIMEVLHPIVRNHLGGPQVLDETD